jgi:hypothetical protein
MPYKIKKSGSGYKVTNKNTGKTYSKKPMSKQKARAQQCAMYANSHEESFDNKLSSILENLEGPVGQPEHDYSDMSITGIDGQVSHDQWDDPGEYPSGAGGGPMASEVYPEFEGDGITISGSPESIHAIKQHVAASGTLPKAIESMAVKAFGQIDPKASVRRWEWLFGPDHVKLWPDDFSSDPRQEDYGFMDEF